MQKVLKTKNPSYNAQAQLDLNRIKENTGNLGGFNKWDEPKIYSDGCAFFMLPANTGFKPSGKNTIQLSAMLAGIDLSIYDELDYASLNIPPVNE